MTNHHPIVPSPEKVDQWFNDAVQLNSTPKYYIATQAAQWGADQELEACCASLLRMVKTFTAATHLEAQRRSDELRTARRPKPPSLKEQALERLELAKKYVDVEPIRLALETLPE
jgi:hypothetical protein